MTIAVAKGDGIGPEIMDAVLNIFNAGGVPLEYVYVDMAKWDTIEELGLLFKGPI